MILTRGMFSEFSNNLANNQMTCYVLLRFCFVFVRFCFQNKDIWFPTQVLLFVFSQNVFERMFTNSNFFQPWSKDVTKQSNVIVIAFSGISHASTIQNIQIIMVNKDSLYLVKQK